MGIGVRENGWLAVRGDRGEREWMGIGVRENGWDDRGEREWMRMDGERSRRIDGWRGEGIGVRECGWVAKGKGFERE